MMTSSPPFYHCCSWTQKNHRWNRSIYCHTGFSSKHFIAITIYEGCRACILLKRLSFLDLNAFILWGNLIGSNNLLSWTSSPWGMKSTLCLPWPRDSGWTIKLSFLIVPFFHLHKYWLKLNWWLSNVILENGAGKFHFRRKHPQLMPINPRLVNIITPNKLLPLWQPFSQFVYPILTWHAQLTIWREYEI